MPNNNIYKSKKLIIGRCFLCWFKETKTDFHKVFLMLARQRGLILNRNNDNSKILLISELPFLDTHLMEDRKTA